MAQDESDGGGQVTTPLGRNLREINAAVGLCLDGGKVLPALILLYSSMDAVAALERHPGEGTKAAFVRWVERHMNLNELGCTGLELYGARCGIVHGFSGTSDLSRTAKARVIVYAWGSVPVDAVREREKGANRKGTTVPVHVGTLRRIFVDGISVWFDDIAKDAARLVRVNEAAETWFVTAGL